MVHSFLLIGQSNMAGRGFLGEVEPIENPNIKIMINGRWQNIFYPVNRDRAFSGVNLAESFADAYSKAHGGVTVGLIPCADGGTSLNHWQEGSLLYDHAIYMSRLAQRTSTIAGVLWHQGESDCASELYPLYEKKFTAIMNALRRDLDLYDVPFVLGGIGDFFEERSHGTYKKVNEALIQISKNNKMTGFASAEGLTANPDGLHFNAASLRELGLRYYKEFEKLENKNKIFAEKDIDSIRTELELL